MKSCSWSALRRPTFAVLSSWKASSRAVSARLSRWRVLAASFYLRPAATLSGAARRGHQFVVGALSVARAVRPAARRAACWSAASAGLSRPVVEPDRYRILTRVFAPVLNWVYRSLTIHLSRICMPRFVTDSRPISAQHPITEFYREEFVKHHRCLQQHRPYFSESAITDVEAALARIMGELESMCFERQRSMNWSAPSSRNSTSSPGSRPGPIPSTLTDPLDRTPSTRSPGDRPGRYSCGRSRRAGDSCARRATRRTSDAPSVGHRRGEGRGGDGRAAAALLGDRAFAAVSSIAPTATRRDVAVSTDRRRASAAGTGQRARPDAGAGAGAARSRAASDCSCCCPAARRR